MTETRILRRKCIEDFHLVYALFLIVIYASIAWANETVHEYVQNRIDYSKGKIGENAFILRETYLLSRITQEFSSTEKGYEYQEKSRGTLKYYLSSSDKKYSMEHPSFSNYIHDYDVITYDSKEIPDNLKRAVQNFLSVRIGPSFSKLAIPISFEKIFVKKPCPKKDVEKVIGLGRAIKAILCRLTIPLSPPGFYEFHVFANENDEVLPLLEIPDLNRNPNKVKILPIECANYLVCQNLGLACEDISNISFGYNNEHGAFVWRFKVNNRGIQNEGHYSIISIRADSFKEVDRIDYVTKY